MASKLPALALDALKPKLTVVNEVTEATLKRYGEELLDQYNIKRRRIEGKRPRRLLSWISRSHAFQIIESDQRLERGVDFFFPLVEACSFECTAFAADAPEERKTKTNFITLILLHKSISFAADAPEEKKDENKFHHPYIIAQVNLLVQGAKTNGIDIKQSFIGQSRGTG